MLVVWQVKVIGKDKMMHNEELKPGKLYVTTGSGKKLEFDSVAKFETSSPSIVIKDGPSRGLMTMYSHISEIDKPSPIKY